MITFEDLEHLTAAIANVFTVLGALTAGFWVYRKFYKYERHWLASRSQPALDVTIEAKLLPALAQDERVLALSSTITNRGRVSTYVELDRSWFLVELASDVVQIEGTVVKEADGRDYMVADSLVDLATRRLRVKMGSPGRAGVRAGASLSLASVSPVVPGIYRITAEYALSDRDVNDFGQFTGDKVSPEDQVVWAASTIVDAR